MNNKERLKYLDSIKGIAALMVAFFHFIERTLYTKIYFLSILISVRFELSCFFIMSGMVIPFSLKKCRSPIINFAISRFFRLYPVYWISILLAIISIFFIKKESIDIKLVIYNASMFQSLF